jgi:CRISPR-associated protein Cas1
MSDETDETQLTEEAAPTEETGITDITNRKKPKNGRGIEKPGLTDLSAIRDRISFLYVDRCKINREDGSVTFTDEKGTARIPAASLSVLMLGPGSDISHRAVELIGETGATIIWVGEYGVRFYAAGNSITHSSALLIRQAALVSNLQQRAHVARQMYILRFPDEDVSGMTIGQLRGKEGTRIRKVYREASAATGVAWNGRMYDPNDFDAGDAVNKALSAGHACLYGVCHAVITALGLAPGLGFVHNGHERAFVYDIADLYKAEITIPLAFELAASAKPGDDIGSLMRRATRDRLSSGHILEHAVRDIHTLLKTHDNDTLPETQILNLWDGGDRFVAAHKGY